MSPNNHSPAARYHPYRRLSAIHLTFAPEAPVSVKCTIHRIFPMDSDPSQPPPIRPLLQKPATLDARAYFAALSIEAIPKRKPPGEAGRPSRGGYTLGEALGWPEDVYKEVQVYHYLPTCISQLSSFPGIHLQVGKDRIACQNFCRTRQTHS